MPSDWKKEARLYRVYRRGAVAGEDYLGQVVADSLDAAELVAWKMFKGGMETIRVTFDRKLYNEDGDVWQQPV